MDTRMPETLVEARISLLPKQGKDITLRQSYRPISLLNVDYKIVTTVLATRLNKILEYYVNEDQVGVVQKRKFRDSTRRCNIIDYYIQGTKVPVLI